MTLNVDETLQVLTFCFMSWCGNLPVHNNNLLAYKVQMIVFRPVDTDSELGPSALTGSCSSSIPFLLVQQLHRTSSKTLTALFRCTNTSFLTVSTRWTEHFFFCWLDDAALSCRVLNLYSPCPWNQDFIDTWWEMSQEESIKFWSSSGSNRVVWPRWSFLLAVQEVTLDQIRFQMFWWYKMSNKVFILFKKLISPVELCLW